MTSYAGHTWILFTSILLFVGSHAKPSEWACRLLSEHELEKHAKVTSQAVNASASHEISHMRSRYSALSI